MPSDLIRSIAALAIVLHHWLNFLEWDRYLPMSGILYAFMSISGTFVQLFYIVSGYGLLVSYYRKPRNWGQWVTHRMRKILFPYWITVFLTFIFASAVGQKYSWHTLLAYITMMRNFFASSWGLNTTLWFMPVLVGLYLSFPILVKALKVYGPVKLLISATIITYSFIFICISFGAIPGHQNAFFLSYLLHFVFGIVLAHISLTKPSLFQFFYTKRSFAIGALVYCFSALISMKWQIGSTFNDFLNGFGLTLMFLGGGKIVQKANQWILFVKISGISYLIYLIHGPIIRLFIKPLWDRHTPVLILLFCGITFSLIFSFLVYQIDIILKKVMIVSNSLMMDRKG